MIYIIIPVFNRWHFTKECLASLILQTYKEYKIVVVDHGSTDGTSENIIKDYPSVIVLKGDESMWWTAATNLGVKYALNNNADFILTLNNDLIVEENYLEELIILYNERGNSLIGSTSIDINNRNYLAFCGVKWNTFTAKYNYMASKLNNDITLLLSNYLISDLLSGRGTLIPITVFTKNGLFDEKYFPHYAADEDFSFNAKKNGFDLIVSTKARVFSHLNSTGLGNKKESFKTKLTSIKSPNHLKTRWYWAKKNTPLPILYYFMDFLRIFKAHVKSING